MARNEFTRKTKREAFERANNRCEGSGPRYGHPEGVRCTADFSRGVIYDHDDPDVNSHDNSLQNCRCICQECNKFKTGVTDIPMIRKVDRIRDKRSGALSAKRPFRRPPPGYNPWTRRIER